MAIRIESDDNIIVYVLDKIISYAMTTKKTFVAQLVWWLTSIIGLVQGFVIYIENLVSQEDIFIRKPPIPLPGQLAVYIPEGFPTSPTTLASA
jgi:hypothetical protein